MQLSINYNYQTFILLFLWTSGMVKSFFNVYIVEIDIVLLALVIAILDVAFTSITNFKMPSRIYLLSLLVILLIYAYILVSLSYSASPEYKYTKAVNFIPNLVFFIYAGTLRKLDMKKMIYWYCIILIPLAVFFIYMKSILWTRDTEATRTFMDLRNNYLAIGLHLGILFFLVHHYLRKIWLLALIFFLLLASSARGALLFTTLTFALFYADRIFTIKIRTKYILRGILTAGGLIVLLAVFWQKAMVLLETSIRRLSLLFSGGGYSTTHRIELMQFALERPFDSISTGIFGYGIGSFAVNFDGTDIRLYPHNLFLEVFFELGILGILLILFLLLLVGYSAMKGKRIWALLFFFCLINAMKSSTLTDLWVLFSMMGIVLNQNRIRVER